MIIESDRTYLPVFYLDFVDVLGEVAVDRFRGLTSVFSVTLCFKFL